MKITTGKIFALLFALALFAMMAGCFNPWEGETGEMGTVIISLAGAEGRQNIDYPPDGILSQLTHVITFTSLSGGLSHPEITLNPGQLETGPIELPVETTWDIQVVATRSGVAGEYARGNISRLRISAGNNPVTILMNPTLNLPPLPPGDTVWLVDHGDNNSAVSYSDLMDARDAITDPGRYSIWLTKDETLLDPINLSTLPTGTTITLRASDNSINLILATTLQDHNLFQVGDGITLVLTEGVNLVGHALNERALVFIDDGGEFRMTGGQIQGNEYGSGVFVDSVGTFYMSGGIIWGNGNEFSEDGGGVYVEGTFNMSGGYISTNKAKRYGGGVYVEGTFNMTGGAIFGNEADEEGGGVYVARSGTFSKSGGGNIFGYDGLGSSNTAGTSEGDAVFVASRMATVFPTVIPARAEKQRNQSALTDVDLNSETDHNWDSIGS